MFFKTLFGTQKIRTQLKFVVPHEILWLNLARHKTNRILTLVHRNLFGTQIIESSMVKPMQVVNFTPKLQEAGD